MAADAAAIHAGAWSIPSTPGTEGEREAGIEDPGAGDDRPRESPDQPSGTGLALSGPFCPGFAGRRVRHGTCTESRRYAVIGRTTGETAAFLFPALGDAEATGWRACRLSRRTSSDVRGGVHAGRALRNPDRATSGVTGRHISPPPVVPDARTRERRAARVEPEAFRRVFEALKPKLLRYCTYRCGDPDAAEDVVQEAMVRLWRRSAREPPSDPEAWLYTTVRHLILDGAKVARNRRRLLAGVPVPASEREPADRAVERAEERERVQGVLRQMPERGREILMLRYSGFSYREIADRVGVASGSVGTLLARAERRFLKLLGPSDGERG